MVGILLRVVGPTEEIAEGLPLGVGVNRPHLQRIGVDHHRIARGGGTGGGRERADAPGDTFLQLIVPGNTKAELFEGRGQVTKDAIERGVGVAAVRVAAVGCGRLEEG